MTFTDLVTAMMEDVKHSNFSGFDVEVRVTYAPDEEGVPHLQVDGSPLLKFSVVKHHKEVRMQPYYFNNEEDEIE